MKLEFQKKIFNTERIFKNNLSEIMNLTQIKGPLFLEKSTGLNDSLSGVEFPVEFIYKDYKLQIVQALTKWKRTALSFFDVPLYEGIFIEMNAIRKDENKLSKYHSINVDQYDWEKTISSTDRTLTFLFREVKKLYEVLKITKKKVRNIYNFLKYDLAKDIKFISSEELLALYPDVSPQIREEIIVKKYKAVFLYEIGYKLSNGIEQGLRAWDYDDWLLNGDILIYDYVNECSLELSSMGIRVDKKSLISQWKYMNKPKWHEYHQNIVNKHLPLSIGGGIGRSRINMFMLEKKHIGQVQATFWPKKYIDQLELKNIYLLR